MSRKSLILLASLVACLICSIGVNATDISGELDTYGELHWTTSENPYNVVGDAWVLNGNTLYIEAGVQAKFSSGKMLDIRAGANIDAGSLSSSSFVTFESAAQNPQAGDWKSIWLNQDNNNRRISAIFKKCIFRHAGRQIGYLDGKGAIVAIGGNNHISVSVLQSTIENCEGWAIYLSHVSADTVNIQSDTIRNNDQGIYISSPGITDIVKCYFEDDSVGINLHGFDAHTFIRNNLLVNVNDGFVSNGFGGTYENLKIQNNIVDGSSGHAIICDYDEPAFYKNFIIVNCDTGVYSPNWTNLPIDTLCIYNTDPAIYGSGLSGGNVVITTNPHFVGTGDYHLTYLSGCINKGSTDNPDPSPDNSPNDFGVYGGDSTWTPFYALIPSTASDFDRTLLWDTYRNECGINVASTQHFTIEAGTTLENLANTGITVQSNATLTAVGANDLNITLNAYSTDRWDGIKLNDGSLATSTLSYLNLDHAYNGIICENDTLYTPIKHCDFTDCQGHSDSKGVYLNISNTGVHACTFSTCVIGVGMNRSESLVDSNLIEVKNYGIYVNDGSTFRLEYDSLYHRETDNVGIYMVNADGKLYCNRIYDVTQGLYLENSDPRMDTTFVDSCYLGMYLISASQPIMTFANHNAANRIFHCDSNEVFISGTLFPLINNGHNDLLRNSAHRYTIYSSPNSGINYDYDVGGNYWYVTGPTNIRALIYPPNQTGFVIRVSSWDSSPNTYSLDEDLIGVGVAMEEQNQYTQAYTYYQNLIANHPNETVAITALRRMFCCAGALNDYSGLYDDYTQMASSISEPQNLFNLSRMEGNTLRAGGSYEEALTFFDVVLTTVINLTDSVFVLMDIENTLYDQQQAGGNGINSNENSFGAHVNRIQDLRRLLESQNQNPNNPITFVPSCIQIHDACPNPFNPSTAIMFSLPQAARVNLKIYDVCGREVATLVNGWRESGTHQVTFEGSRLASGIYICRLSAGEFSASKKIILMK